MSTVQPDKREVSPEEAKHVKSLLDNIKRRRESKSIKDYHARIKKNREYVGGKQQDDGNGGLVRSNLVYAEIVGQVASLYARDPEISVTPGAAVSEDRYKTMKKFGQTCEVVLNSQFGPKGAGLKPKVKAAVRATMTASIGWLKVVFQQDIANDPVITERRNDSQDEVQRLDALIKSIEQNDTDGVDVEALKVELADMMKALTQHLEVSRATGLTIGIVSSEDMLWSENVRHSELLPQSEWMAERIWFAPMQAKARLDYMPDKYTRYTLEGTEETTGKADDDSHLMCAWEYWHYPSKTVYTVVEGYDGYVRKPFNPKKVGQRWFGYFALIFNPIDGSPIPLSDVELLCELQDEHNEARTNFREHRKASLPVHIGLAGALSPKDAQKIRDRNSNEVVLIDGDETKPLRQYFEIFQNAPIDPAVYSTEHIRVDWETLTRRGDAARGVVQKAKTAYEASLQQNANSQNSSERSDIVEDFVRDMAQYALEICLLEMSLDEVKAIAGDDAEWPQMDREQIFNLVSLSVRAGSTGKPSQAQEQERWMNMLPILRDTLMQVAQLRTQGQEDEADMLMKLLEETLTRFDERIDLDDLLPPKKDAQDPQVMQQKMQAMQQQQEQALTQLSLLKSEIAANISKATLNIAQAEAAEIGSQLDMYMGRVDSILKMIDSGQQQQQQQVAQPPQLPAPQGAPTTIQ